MILTEGDILVHKISGTFAEVSKSAHGYVLHFTMRYGGKVTVSKTQIYAASEITAQWRHIESEEMQMYNKGKLTING